MVPAWCCGRVDRESAAHPTSDIIAIGAWLVIGLGRVGGAGRERARPKLGRGGRRDAASPVAICLLGLTYGLASGWADLGRCSRSPRCRATRFWAASCWRSSRWAWSSAARPGLAVGSLRPRLQALAAAAPVRIGPLRTTTVSLVSGLLLGGAGGAAARDGRDGQPRRHLVGRPAVQPATPCAPLGRRDP